MASEIEMNCNARLARGVLATQTVADLKAARRVLEDFEKRGGVTLEALKRELGLLN